MARLPVIKAPSPDEAEFQRPPSLPPEPEPSGRLIRNARKKRSVYDAAIRIVQEDDDGNTMPSGVSSRQTTRVGAAKKVLTKVVKKVQVTAAKIGHQHLDVQSDHEHDPVPPPTAKSLEQVQKRRIKQREDRHIRNDKEAQEQSMDIFFPTAQSAPPTPRAATLLGTPLRCVTFQHRAPITTITETRAAVVPQTPHTVCLVGHIVKTPRSAATKRPCANVHIAQDV